MDYYGLSESDVLPEGLGQVFTMPEKDRRKATVPMATNPPSGDGHRNGAVRKRSQFQNPVTGLWSKRNAENGQIMGNKQDGKPFKGVRKEK